MRAIKGNPRAIGSISRRESGRGKMSPSVGGISSGELTFRKQNRKVETSEI